MCYQRLKRFSVLSVLYCLLLFSPFCFSCSAEVRLTDKEAQELQTQIEESKKELETVKTELNNVKSTYSEQKKYYEEQLKEAEKKETILKATSISTGSGAVVLLAVVVLLIIF